MCVSLYPAGRNGVLAAGAVPALVKLLPLRHEPTQVITLTPTRALTPIRHPIPHLIRSLNPITLSRTLTLTLHPHPRLHRRRPHAPSKTSPLRRRASRR